MAVGEGHGRQEALAMPRPPKLRVVAVSARAAQMTPRGFEPRSQA